MYRFQRRFGLALSTLLLCAFAPSDAGAATQCINSGAPAPLEYCLTDAGRPSVYVFQPNNPRVRQYYGGSAWGSVIWLNGTSTASRYSTGYTGAIVTTGVSNTLTGTGSAGSPWTITNITNLGASGVQMTQVVRYVNGDRTLRKTFTIANNGASTFNDVRFFHGGDTEFGGDDNARSWYDASNKMVYVTNPAFTNTGFMGFYANPATPSSAYFGGQYSTGNAFASSTAQLPSTANSAFVDAGYYLQWNRASLTPGQSWSIDSYEIWSPPGAVQVLSPASDYVSPGTTVTRIFRVQNLSGGPLTIALSVAATPDAWVATLQGAGSVVVNSLAIVDVPVDIVVPPGAAAGTTQNVTLSAVATTNTGVGATRLSILQVDYVIAPEPASFGTVVIGNSADLSVTLTNGVAAAAVQIGSVASANPLAAPFSVVADTCSNTTIAAAGTCAVTVRFAPTAATASDDTFNIPIMSPIITTHSIAVSGIGSVLASFMVTASAGAGGSMAPISHTVISGNTTSFTFTPDANYTIAGGTGCGGSLAGSVYTTAAITGACTVSATFALATHTVSATAGAGGAITPASTSVASGSTTSFMVTPDAGFSIAVVNGCAGSLAGNIYTTGAVAGACSVTATFALNSYPVSASAGSGGAISPAGIMVSHGSTTTFTVTPAAGYAIASVSGCGGALSGNTYTTANIGGACAVSATFSLVEYTVTATAEAGGAISPASSLATHGSTATFTITPDTGHTIGAVTGCDGTLTGSTYTTGEITGICAVTATFSIESYTVTASAGANGSISPGSASVDHGGTADFTLTPAAGYSVAAVSGCGGTRIGNTFTTGIVTGACSVAATFSLSQPVFTPAMPATINLTSTGLTTMLPANAKPTAVDLAGTALTVTLVGGQTDFAPGAHMLVWRTVDSRGVEATVQQILHVWPIVSLGSDISLGYVAGNSGAFRIALNGVAPVYPFDVSYAVSGYLQDHDLESGTAQFLDGEVEKDVYVAVTASAAPGTAPQRIDVALDDASSNRGAQRALSIALITANAPASVHVRGAQENEGRPAFARVANMPVTLHVAIADPNSADTHTVTWSGPPGALFTIVNGELVLDPMSLPAGVHHFVVMVSDSGSPAANTSLRFDVVLLATVPALPEGSVGWADSALPANPDYSPPTRNVLPGQAQDLQHGLLEAEPGVQLALGSHVREQGVAQAELAGTGLSSLPGDDVVNSGGVFDFEVLSLPKVGQSTSIVISQTAPIGAHAVYRLYDPVARTWHSFVAGPGDSVASAPGSGGVCPPPESAVYQPGLTAGDTCVRLTISDGGSNDADKGINGSISNLGGVAAMNEVTVTATGAGRRGGAIDVLFLVFGFGLLALRQLSRRKLAVLAACVLPALASAGEGSGWYAGGQWGTARSSASEGDMNRKLDELGYDVTVDFEHTSRSAWKLFGGYRFSPYVGLQLGYTNLGEVDSRLSGNIIDVNQLLADVTLTHPHSADGIEGALTGRFPFGPRFAAIGRVGLLRWDSTYRAYNSEGEEFARFENSGTDLVVSAGFSWKVASRWDLSADFSRYDVDGEKIGLLAIGAVWNFGAP